MTQEEIKKITEDLQDPFKVATIGWDAYLISDLHFCHPLEAMLKTRNCETVDEMDAKVIKNWNETIGPDDLVLVLGDVYFGGQDSKGPERFEQLNGHKIIIPGNHDSPAKLKRLAKCRNTTIVNAGSIMVKFGKDKHTKNFLLSHYPTITDNFDLEKPFNFAIRVFNAYGHIHDKQMFPDGSSHRCHVGADALDCRPIRAKDMYREMQLMEIKNRYADIVKDEDFAKFSEWMRVNFLSNENDEKYIPLFIELFKSPKNIDKETEKIEKEAIKELEEKFSSNKDIELCNKEIDKIKQEVKAIKDKIIEGVELFAEIEPQKDPFDKMPYSEPNGHDEH